LFHDRPTSPPCTDLIASDHKVAVLNRLLIQTDHHTTELEFAGQFHSLQDPVDSAATDEIDRNFITWFYEREFHFSLSLEARRGRFEVLTPARNLLPDLLFVLSRQTL
jgi:hypothetical protein